MNAADCEFVMIGGLWLPAVAGIERTPVYIGDYERAVSGVLRTAHVGKAMEWRVLLQGVAGEDVEALEEVLRSPLPVGCNIMGTEVIASVTELSSAHNPKRHGPDADWGRMNYEILVREVVVEQITPGFTYEYEAFLSEGPFVWDWDAAGQPDEVDVLLVAGGGGGGAGSAASPPDPAYGGGGGGAGGVSVTTGMPVSGNVSGSIGAGGTQGNNGQNTTFGSLPAVIGGGRGGSGLTTSAGSGGSGGGAVADAAPGAGTPGQGHAGYRGTVLVSPIPGGGSSITRLAGGGGGAGEGDANTVRRHGGSGVDLLALGWNYRLVPGVTRYVGGGGGGGGAATTTGGGGGGVGGGGAGALNAPASPGAPNTGGGGGGGYGTTHPGAPGGSGLVIVRWLVNS